MWLRSRVPWLALFAGSVLILWFHIAGMLHKPHYQFIIVVPVLIWILWAGPSEHGQSLRGTPRGSWLTVFGLGLSFIGLLASSYVWSPWGAAVSSLLAAFFFFCHIYGWRWRSLWMPAWLMGFTLVPLPFGWDERVTLLLRGVTTRVTSQVLDLFAVLHVTYMNVIEVPSKRLFIADACSGVHSLYVLLAASLFWGLLNRRSMLHLLALLGSTVGIVLLENIARLVIIVSMLRWQMDLSEGTDHTILGLILFGMSAAMIISTDRLLLFLLPDFPIREVPPQRDYPVSHSRRVALYTSWCLCALFPLCGVVQYLRMPAALPDLTSSFRSEPELKELGENGLPDTIGGFRRTEFRKIERVLGDPFGQQSQQWVYTRGPLVVQASLDYPFDGFHDSTICYAQVGWKIDSAETLHVDEAGEFVLAKMSRSLEGEAYLIFSQADQKGATFARLKNQVAGLQMADAGNRLRSLLKGSEPPKTPAAALPLIQIQLLARSAMALSAQDREQVIQFYRELRQRAIAGLELSRSVDAVARSNRQESGQ